MWVIILCFCFLQDSVFEERLLFVSFNWSSSPSSLLVVAFPVAQSAQAMGWFLSHLATFFCGFDRLLNFLRGQPYNHCRVMEGTEVELPLVRSLGICWFCGLLFDVVHRVTSLRQSFLVFDNKCRFFSFINEYRFGELSEITDLLNSCCLVTVAASPWCC